MLGLKKKYCYTCGVEVKGRPHIKFGRYFCSESHAEEYAEELRKARRERIAREEERHSHGGCC